MGREHAGGGKTSRHERSPPRYVHTWLQITRTLVEFIEESEQLASKIKLQFSTRLIDVDLKHRRLRVVGQRDDQVSTLNYDVLVGADGAHSAVGCAAARGGGEGDNSCLVLFDGTPWRK